ncbi:MAG: DUF2868 domain-containing protein [Deltaproteobacteria bacterium]|nr:DUF2868 domain-containing protein [Deltaproteobacteria bacterium]
MRTELKDALGFQETQVASEIILNEHQAVRLLLIRAIEEKRPDIFSEEVRAGANCQALDADTELGSLDRRAKILFDNAPEPIKVFNRAALYWMRPLPMAVFILILGSILGMASNFLGNLSQFHIVKNPIVFLILWNLGVYVVLFLLWHRRRSLASRTSLLASPDVVDRRLPDSCEVADVKLSGVRSGPGATSPPGHNWFVRLFLRPVFEKLLQLWVYFTQGIAETKIWTGTLHSFFTYYFKAAGQVVDARLHYILHLLNIGLVMGVLAGTYWRSLFFEYNAVWESTFIRAPATLATILNAVLGMASLVLDGRWFTPADVEPLLHANGTLAGPWIHKLTVMALLLVVVPRSILMWLSSLRVRRCTNQIEIDMSEPYFVDVIREIGQCPSCSGNDDDVCHSALEPTALVAPPALPLKGVTMEIANLLIKAFEALSSKPDEIYIRSQNYTVSGWCYHQEGLAGVAGGGAAIVPGLHIPAMGLDIGILVNRMGECCYGIGGIMGSASGKGNVLEKEDLANILALWSGAISVDQLDQTLTQDGGAKLGGKIARPVLGKVVAVSLGVLGTAGSLTATVATKVSAKLGAKIAAKMVAGWIPFAGALVSGGINVWLVSSVANTAEKYYMWKVRHLDFSSGGRSSSQS